MSNVMSLYYSLRPPTPTLTEKNLADQSGKVFIVTGQQRGSNPPHPNCRASIDSPLPPTGASSGVGEQLASILYQHNAKVYVAARSEAKASKAIEGIKSTHATSKGELVYLHLDLNDLTTIKQSAEDFLSREDRLDVLWNNAGVMVPPQGSKSAQGHELQLGTNNVAPFLFTKLLLPILAKTAKTAPPNNVRVVWVSSTAAVLAPKPAIDLSNMDYQKDEIAWIKYNRSKAGNVVHSAEFARRYKDDGIISIQNKQALNPGNLKTDLQRNVSRIQLAILHFILYPPIYGAYTELYAGLSPDITQKDNGGWVSPWGRLEPGRKDLLEPDLGRKFWEWTEKQVKEYE
ncbi:MAG: hypothetical protein Q9187_006891 [Circinaria calcarea]